MKSKEEIVASKLYDLLSDYRLESYLIGRYFAQMAITEIYEKFEEMVESARQEKQNRIDWIKEIIIGETEMTTSFENKCRILGDLFLYYSEESDWFDWCQAHDVTLPLAHCYSEGLVEVLSVSGQDKINETFEQMLLFVGIEDTGFETVNDIYDSAPEFRFEQVEEE